MSARDTSTDPIEGNSTQATSNTAMADVSELQNSSEASDTDLEGDFILFPKLPASVRERIWKYSLPSGRVVDLVFDKDQDRYFSFHAIVPAVIHTSKESRAVGLRFYTLCFGTESHAASIPLDFTVDCLLFDDWLAPRSTQYFRSKPPIPCAIQPEMERIIGPMGSVECNGIHRIAIPIDLYMWFKYDKFVEGLQFLFDTFPSTDYLVFVIEDREPPYSPGPIHFWGFPMWSWCCEKHLVAIKTNIPAAVNEALMQSDDETDNNDRDSEKVQLRFQGVSRNGQWRSITHTWFCKEEDKEEDRVEELLKPY
jgi:hypothetical protein